MLWNIKQVAEYLCLSKSKVYQMASKGEIPSVKIGDCIRFREDDIESFVIINIKNKVEKPTSIPYYNPTLGFNSQYMR